jgi:hypothetical protein
MIKLNLPRPPANQRSSVDVFYAADSERFQFAGPIKNAVILRIAQARESSKNFATLALNVATGFLEFAWINRNRYAQASSTAAELGTVEGVFLEMYR